MWIYTHGSIWTAPKYFIVQKQHAPCFVCSLGKCVCTRHWFAKLSQLVRGWREVSSWVMAICSFCPQINILHLWLLLSLWVDFLQKQCKLMLFAGKKIWNRVDSQHSEKRSKTCKFWGKKKIQNTQGINFFPTHRTLWDNRKFFPSSRVGHWWMTSTASFVDALHTGVRR